MKRLLALILFALFLLTACGNTDIAHDSNNPLPATEATTTEAGRETGGASSAPTADATTTPVTEVPDAELIKLILCEDSYYAHSEDIRFIRDESLSAEEDNIPIRKALLVDDKQYMGCLNVTYAPYLRYYDGADVYSDGEGIYVVFYNSKHSDEGSIYAEYWTPAEAGDNTCKLGEVLYSDAGDKSAVISYNGKYYTRYRDQKLTVSDIGSLNDRVDSLLGTVKSGSFLEGHIKLKNPASLFGYDDAEVYMNDAGNGFYIALTEPRANTAHNYTYAELWIETEQTDISDDSIIGSVIPEEAGVYRYISDPKSTEEHLGPFIEVDGKFYEYYDYMCPQFVYNPYKGETDEHFAERMKYIQNRLIENIAGEYLGKNIDVAAAVYGIRIPGNYAVLTSYDRQCDCEYYMTEYGVLEIMTGDWSSDWNSNYAVIARIWNEHDLDLRFEEIADGGPIDYITYNGQKYYDYAQIGRGVYYSITPDIAAAPSDTLAVIEAEQSRLLESYPDAEYIGNKITYAEEVDVSIDLMTNMEGYKYGLNDYELYYTSEGILMLNKHHEYSAFNDYGVTVGVLFTLDYE